MCLSWTCALIEGYSCRASPEAWVTAPSISHQAKHWNTETLQCLNSSAWVHSDAHCVYCYPFMTRKHDRLWKLLNSMWKDNCVNFSLSCVLEKLSYVYENGITSGFLQWLNTRRGHHSFMAVNPKTSPQRTTDYIISNKHTIPKKGEDIMAKTGFMGNQSNKFTVSLFCLTNEPSKILPGIKDLVTLC